MIDPSITVFEGQVLKLDNKDFIVLCRSSPHDTHVTGFVPVDGEVFMKRLPRDGHLRHPTFKESKIKEVQEILATPYNLNGYTDVDRKHLIEVELPKIMALPDDCTPPPRIT